MLYWRTYVANRYRGGSLRLLSIRDYILLLPGGRAYAGLPTGGHVLDMDYAAACQAHPAKCGTYHVDGSAIHLAFPRAFGAMRSSDGKWVSGPEGRLELDGEQYRVVPAASGSSLDGRYTKTFAQVSGGAGQSVSTSSSTYIDFKPDGHYQKSGFSAFSFNTGAASGASQDATNQSSGRYSINGYRLTLIPDGGGPEQHTFFLGDASSKPEVVYIDDAAFSR